MGSEQSTEAQFEAEALSYRSYPDDDFRDLRPAYLDKFIAEQLQVDEYFRNLVYTALDSLCRYLQRHMRPPTLNRLIKGGSMGKGTALKGRSDLDCILVMNGVRDAPDLRQKISGILAQLEGLLDRNPLRDQGWGITVIKVDRFLVQIEMHHFQWNESVDVDILPTFDADVRSNEYSLRQLYNSMAGYDWYTQALCSAALAELQRDFIKSKPAKLKNLIRLVKHWCKKYLPCENGQPRVPNSYLLELLTIDVWENAGSPLKFTTAELFNNVMEALYNHSQLNVKWDKHYSPSRIQFGMPRVMDPANPYNNLYKVVKDWERVKRVIRETLQKPLLQNYTSSLLDTEEIDEESSSASNCIIS